MRVRALRYAGWLVLYGLLHAVKMLVDWAIERVEQRIKGEDGKGEEKSG